MSEKFKHRIEHQYKIGNRFYTQDITIFNINCTWEDMYKAIYSDTLNWFRQVENKLIVTKTLKNDKLIITVFSYAPYDNKVRDKIIFEEI